MFTHSITVQLHHTDAYGIIFFSNQFKFCHDAFQAFLEQIGMRLPQRREDMAAMLVIVHAESDYKAPVHLGDRLRIEVRVEALGNTSIAMLFMLHNQDGILIGQTRTVHVWIATSTSTKLPLPEVVRKSFAPHVG